MADQNKADAGSDEFYSEILSPSELFAARSRSHKIPVRGQKDFEPDDSEEQRRRLEQSLSEHWSLVSEERVERLGNLVKAVWRPDQQAVQLESPAGKFWQTMGFSEAGRQFLLPEEALYLMECGSVQVFHQDLPLSIQDGYESFLSSGTVSLQQYQVFGHLKRLGYVVLRFDPSSGPSSYARRLNLPRWRDKAGGALKRKRSASPTPSTSGADGAGDSPCGRTEDERVVPAATQQELLPQSNPTAPPGASDGPSEGGGAGTWWTPDVPGPSGPSGPGRPSGGASCWDFSAFSFPDLGSGGPRRSDRLAPPDPSLLPGSLTVGECDVAPWRRKVNLRPVRMSWKERREEEERRRRRRDVNEDSEVRRCRNWAQYQALQARRRGEPDAPPAHLWSREVNPLHDPSRPLPTAELLEKLSVIQPTDLLEGASRLKGSHDWTVCFDVYQPDSVADFKKSNPGKPHCRMCVCSFDDPVPDLRAVKLLALQSGEVPVVVAVVDHGDISFYTFKDFHLPRDVFP